MDFITRWHKEKWKNQPKILFVVWSYAEDADSESANQNFLPSQDFEKYEIFDFLHFLGYIF